MVLSSSTNVGTTAGTVFGTVTAASVETVNITASNTSTANPIVAVTEVLTLVATSATTLNLAGSAALNLTNTGNVALTRIDGSTMTGALTVQAAGTVAETILGGSGKDVLSASTGTVGDSLYGNAGNDRLVSNAGLTTLNGGDGADTFVIATPGANLNTYTIIADALKGDTIELFGRGTETFNTIKVPLMDTASFQDFADAAAVGDGSVNGIIRWFQYGGNTYIVEDLSAAATFVNGADIVVRLTGTANDLALASFNTGTPSLLLA